MMFWSKAQRGVWLAAVGVAGVISPVAATQPRLPDSRTQALVSASRAAPPEFAADVLLRMIESGVIRDTQTQRELLDEAFALAALAQEKQALRRVDGGGAFTGAVNNAFTKGLDQVSLRSRVVRQLLKISPKIARERFDQIDLPLARRFECEEQFAFSLSIYYRVMSEVMNSIPQPSERDQFAKEHLVRFVSTSQVMPIVGLLLEVKGSPEGLATAASSLAGQLPKLDQDRRVFTLEVPGAIRALVRLARALPSAYREELIERSRSWVLNGLSNGLCAERTYIVRNQDGTRETVVPVSPAERFNKELGALSDKKPPPTIRLEDVKYVPPGPPAAADRYSNQWQQFSRQHNLLERDTADEKDSPRWQEEMQKYVTALAEWRPTSDRPDIHYLEKCERLRAALGMQRDPIGPRPARKQEVTERPNPPRAKFLGRDQVMGTLVELFGASESQTIYAQRRIVWFAPVLSLIESAEHTAELDNLLVASKHPVLHLYGVLSQVQAADPDRLKRQPPAR